MNNDGEKFGKREMKGNKNPAEPWGLRDERYVEEMYYSSIQFSIVIPSTRLKCFALFVTIIIIMNIGDDFISRTVVLPFACELVNP